VDSTRLDRGDFPCVGVRSIMAGIIGLILLVGGAVLMFGDVPLGYKCLSPLAGLVGLGLLFMDAAISEEKELSEAYTIRQDDPWSAEVAYQAAEIAAVMDGRMRPEDCKHSSSPSIAGMTKTVRDVKNSDGEVIRQVVKFK